MVNRHNTICRILLKFQRLYLQISYLYSGDFAVCKIFILKKKLLWKIIFKKRINFFTKKLEKIFFFGYSKYKNQILIKRSKLMLVKKAMDSHGAIYHQTSKTSQHLTTPLVCLKILPSNLRFPPKLFPCKKSFFNIF